MKKNFSKIFQYIKKSPFKFSLLFLGIIIICTGIFMGLSKADSSSTTTLGSIGETLLNDDAYIELASMVDDSTTESKTAIITGSEPFDTEYGEDISVQLKAGDDNTPKNSIVRTFDMVDYTVGFATKAHKNSENVAFKNGKIYFEFVLPYSKEQIAFDTQNMRWLESKTNIYYKIIEFEHVNEDDSISKWQTLKGSFTIMPSEGEETSIGNHYRELNISLRVIKMKNKDTIQPYFTFWLQGNDVFNSQEFDSSIETWYSDDSLITFSENKCHTHTDDQGDGIQEYQTITPPKVTVTATPRYNISIINGAEINDQSLGTFDFGIGNELAQNTEKGLVNGRLVGFGITIELYGKSKEYGLFGVEIPYGEISFDLKLTSNYKNQKVTEDYQPLIYSINENNYYDFELKNGRRAIRRFFSKTPYNTTVSDKNNYNSCFNGGSWKYTIDGDVIHITVTDYDIDVEQFPYTVSNHTASEYTYYNPNEISNYWEIQRAVFSSGVVWLVQDFYNSNEESDYFGKYILDQYGEDLFKTTLEQNNLKMTSIGGTTIDTQMVTEDDSITQSHQLEKKGILSNSLLNVVYNYTDYLDTITDDGAGKESGRYIHISGEKLKIESFFIHDNAEGFNMGVGYDQLLKWDDVFFEPDGNVDNFLYSTDGININYKYFYGAKPDKSGWNHKGLKPDEDGYDQEMREAVVDDLIYFESLDELKNSGYVPVALFIEYRGLASSTMNHLHIYVGGKVKDDCPTGYTYMSIYTLRGWNKNGIKDSVAQANGIVINTPEDYIKITDEMYDTYAKNKIPSRQNPNIKNYSSYPSPFEVHEKNEEYQKAKYDENGFVSGSYGLKGSSCYVIDHFMNASIKTAQAGANEDGSKRVYDLDEGQRTVDFMISPSIVTGFSKELGRKKTINIIIEASVGKGLTYIEGSSKIGGTYQESLRGQGVIKDGKSINPTIIKNEDGTTTLRWILYDYDFTMDKNILLDKIYYSCQIGNLSSEESDVKNGQIIDTIVKIRSNEDYIRPYLEKNKNTQTSSIYIQKSNALSLFNFPDKISNELTKGTGFLVSYQNSSNDPSSIILVNGLPYNGDGVSSFNGDLKVTELSVGNRQGDNPSLLQSFNFYYTTNTGYRGKTSKDLENENFLDTGTWTKLNISDFNGNQDNPKLPNAIIQIPDDFSPVLIVAVGILNSQEKIEMHLTMQLPDGDAGDFVANFSSQGKIESYSYAYFVSRMLEGKVWIDSNQNGLQESQEEEIAGVNVSLMKLKEGREGNQEDDYEPYTMTISGVEKEVVVTTGNQINVITGKITPYENSFPSTVGLSNNTSSGSYRFYNLPAGVYGVKFESSDKIYLSDYRLSQKDQGLNDEIDSDGIATYDSNNELEKVFIENIILESIENIDLRYYESRYHDIGISRVYRLNLKKVGEEDLKKGLSGAKFSIYQLDCNNPSHTNHNHIFIDPDDVDSCFKYLGDSTSDKNGDIVFKNLLDQQEYRLLEKKAPLGRKRLEDQWKVFVGEEYEIETIGVGISQFIYEDEKWLIANQKIGLPITGGFGNLTYFITGSILIAISLIGFFWIYKKMRKYN